MINYVSSIAMPMVIFIIILYGTMEKKKTFDIFLKGAKDGIKIVISIFPTLVGLFLAIGLLRNSGLLECIINMASPLLIKFQVPSEILPLALLRPISGSASIAIATDIMKSFGVDSNIGIIASVIMGSTETTLYTIAVYTSSVNIKNTKYVLPAALIADFVGITTSIIVCRIMS
ncbi:MAG: spore maturation protein [Clostridia bacterium]|nr:spore maturation protein [Clostridia bacterium]